MAGFHTKTFINHDDYMTPLSAWKNIEKYIPKDKIIWEAFYGDGKSGDNLKNLGFNVIHEKIDFFENNLGDIIVSNPPFSKIKEILIRLKEINKPFILILPVSKINTNYFRNTFGNKNLKIIIPRSRIQFEKKVNGQTPKNYINKCNFDCFYYCYKIETIENTITWLQK
jgi:hypothetical protein